MELPSWFLSAIQERLEHVVARIERHPEMRKLRAEESSAFEAMFSGVDRTKLPGFVDWEDKHHYKRGVENEHLYIKGLRDGVQLAITLLDYPIAVFDNPKTMARSEKRDTESELEDLLIMKPNKRVKASGELARRLCHEYRKEWDASSSSNISINRR